MKLFEEELLLSEVTLQNNLVVIQLGLLLDIFLDEFRSNITHSQINSFSLLINAVLKTTWIQEVQQDFTYY